MRGGLRNGMLIAQALVEFALHDVLMWTAGFGEVYKRVRSEPVNRASSCALNQNQIANAAELAGILYFKRVRCLQFSIALTRLLRRRGFAADVVIGCLASPFAAHAWVESGNQVFPATAGVNRALFQELDRF